MKIIGALLVLVGLSTLFLEDAKNVIPESNPLFVGSLTVLAVGIYLLFWSWRRRRRN